MSQPARILISLVAGLVLGISAAAWGGAALVANSVAVAEPVGGVWLDGLRMTIIPLVMALLVTGIASTAEAARAGGLAGRTIVLIVILLWSSCILAAALTPLFLHLWPLPASGAAALKAALSGTTAPPGDVPGFSEFIRSIVPSNPIAAAANDAILPLIVFTIVFAFAVTRLEEGPRRLLTDFFSAVASAMLVVIGWVLWLAPVGVFALAYVVGAKAGGAAVGALVHYILTVAGVGIVILLLAYPVAVIAGGVGLGRFARAVAPSQAVALSTQSSLATLPSMLAGAEKLGVPVATGGVVLPLAVAIFRVTSPAMNLAVVLYIAYWFGVPLGPAHIVAGIAVASITTMGSVGIPGQASFITSIAPIALAMGVPIAPLGLLVAVETFPDIVRTVGNVTMDVALARIVARFGGLDEPEAAAETDGVAP